MLIMIIKNLTIFILMVLGFGMQNTSAEPFLFDELNEELHDFVIKKPQFLKASDGVKLAYYSFVPTAPKAVVIFYHGAGFYSSALYQSFAQQLVRENIGCYLFDIRGHGYSEGSRGDAPAVTQVWDDVTRAIDFVNKQHPETALYVGGHSSGAGMILNYSNYNHHQLVKGYVFITPYLGRNSGAIKNHADQTTSFIKSVSVWKFIVNALTGGFFCGHSPAVFFNYPQALLTTDPKIVSSYSVTMTMATSPEDPKALFKALDKSFLLLVASDDEQFVPEKLIEYKKFATNEIQASSVAQIIPKATHLGSMLKSASLCADFVKSFSLL